MKQALRYKFLEIHLKDGITIPHIAPKHKLYEDYLPSLKIPITLCSEKKSVDLTLMKANVSMKTAKADTQLRSTASNPTAGRSTLENIKRIQLIPAHTLVPGSVK
ncbi:hypothetical protein H7F15_18445 [Pontibacter sp. Tf4]|uniref:hypothetical protein n=1 Tax=Pontibacter sp. Tf4 TaxID=2761620 RepID=UPI00162A66BD|nr:hypothetical protein [Pontibacter sp. Tf4]MBB6613027.1 hypothetical protein [Pontibacter sp. Tf4]